MSVCLVCILLLTFASVCFSTRPISRAESVRVRLTLVCLNCVYNELHFIMCPITLYALLDKPHANSRVSQPIPLNSITRVNP